MRFGAKCEDGFLPAYSVDTEEEARTLLTLACPLSLDGEYVATELAEEQTIDNLFAFGRRLEKLHKMILKRRKHASVSAAVR